MSELREYDVILGGWWDGHFWKKWKNVRGSEDMLDFWTRDFGILSVDVVPTGYRGKYKVQVHPIERASVSNMYQEIFRGDLQAAKRRAVNLVREVMYDMLREISYTDA